VRLKLYISMCLLAVKEPHGVFGTAYLWADALGLPDYQNNGARRVRDARHWLENARLIRVERAKGKNPRVYMLSQAGTGRPYKRPPSRGVPYASLPVAFWDNGWILEMTPSAIAALLVLLQCQYGRDEGDYFWVRDAKRYDLSPETWNRGTAELGRLGFLKKKRAIRGDELEVRRRRNLYWLDLGRFDDLPGAK
jgi:hypothetical protein